MYAIYNLTSCVFSQSVRYSYEICVVLVPIFQVLWGLVTIYSVKFTKCEICDLTKLVALPNCAVAVCVPCLFLTVLCVGLQSVVVTFSGHIHLFLKKQSTFAQAPSIYLYHEMLIQHHSQYERK